VVGAYRDDREACTDCGSAYVYRFNGSSWVEEQKLTASDGAVFDYFGYSVSVSGNVAVVGAYQRNCPGSDCGAAYVYRFNESTWLEEEKLTASDAAASDQFGISVSISGDVVVVGANSDDRAAANNCGSAYVYFFIGSSWVQEHKLKASDAAAGDQFGTSVSITGDVVAVGAPFWSGSDSGAAYVFSLDGLPLFLDCNANDVNDSCDIDQGYSTDANGNNIPDECDTTLPPFIIEHAVSQTVCDGATVVFTVQAGGMPPFTYLWRKDESELSGETGDSLTLTDVSSADEGDYDVIVTNSLDSTTSDPTTLTVITVAQLALSPDPSGIAKNRFLSFIPTGDPCLAAIRVRMVESHNPPAAQRGLLSAARLQRIPIEHVYGRKRGQWLRSLGRQAGYFRRRTVLPVPGVLPSGPTAMHPLLPRLERRGADLHHGRGDHSKFHLRG